VAALAGKCQQIFMAAVFAFHTGEAVVQITAIEIAIDHLLDIGPPESILSGEMLVIDPDKSFKIILYATVVIRRLLPLAGSITLLFVAACLFLLSTLGVGLYISTISSTQQQAMMTTFFFMLPFFMLSGFIFPIENMPLLVQWLTYLNPLRHFLVIIRGIFLKGVGFATLWEQFAALLVIGVVLFAAAIQRFSKRLD
jgi:ABC-2 type transport system permease protein